MSNTSAAIPAAASAAQARDAGAGPSVLGDDPDFDAAMARFHVRRPDGRPPRALPGIVHGLGYRLVLRVRKLWRKPDAVCELPPR